MVTNDPQTIIKIVKNQLWENCDLLRSIVQSSPLAIAVLDIERKVKLLNYGAETMFGWQEEELIGKCYPIFSEEKSLLLKRIQSEEIIINVEVILKKRSGLLIDVNFSSVHLYEDHQFSGYLIICEDITKRKKAELDLKQSIRELKDIKFALDQSAIIAITDPYGKIRYVNDKFCEISKYKRSELLGQDHRIVNSGYHPRSYFYEMWRTIRRGQVWQGEVKNKAKDGKYYWVQTTIVPFLDESGEPYQYVSIRSDISKRKLVEEKVRLLAYYDELTNLPNRTYFKNQINQVLSEDRNEQIAVISVDLDRFKLINDTLGHRYGDLLLKAVAERLKSNLQPDDFIARHGGDEFLIFLRNVSYEDIKAVVRKCMKSLQLPIRLDQSDHFASISMGISLYPQDGTTFEELYQKADIALNRVKKQGRNSFQFFESTMDHSLSRELQIEKNLRTAIDYHEFTLHYQPKQDIQTKRIVGVEALIRWENREIGNVSPGEFIPIAEETGMISDIGEWVLRTACLQMINWQSRGLQPITISVNLSVRQFMDNRIIESITTILKETKLNPKFLELEITENVAVHEKEYVNQKLRELRDLGIKISIDDFGTGYSSLSYLKDYPIDTLKIDKSFVDEIIKNGDSSIVRAIIAMAHSLQMSVIAEGVEVKEQLEFLKAHNCDQIQGFLISKPLAASQFETEFLMV
ncbi:putative bifunctional diguanylate cyclase/phosphodiesterase [Alkalihalobacterium elongatum]|uniref:putative bifunctional diguanylate cyclase/phosphodiesterase n=1 Tax=Alkalihalobacterium elongatum TaxID=2675466 RepID=UPI001C1FAB36|nr:bifunctional diguanylate cyclase/phosphodiesterase [Alkalihalobacterium elongatum]